MKSFMIQHPQGVRYTQPSP